MDLPDPLKRALTEEIQGLWGRSCSIETATRVLGGDINEAAQLTLNDGRSLFLKYNPFPLPKLFEVEARGLEILREASALRVPQVYAVGEVEDTYPAYILMDWIPAERSSTRGRSVMKDFGLGLAHLHERHAPRHGLDHDNYIGSLPQYNGREDSWATFYRDRRLGVQRDLARERNRLPRSRERLLDSLMERIERFVPEGEASLLHGDLWGGNYLISSGQPVLIDPAVSFGHREVELAFTELFGGFPEEFYRGYNEGWPIDPDYEDRRPLYQLYPLLVHLNLFGESYGRQVDSILHRYVG